MLYINEIIKDRANDKMYFSSWEIFRKVVCCGGCLGEKLWKKNKVFEKAVRNLKLLLKTIPKILFRSKQIY